MASRDPATRAAARAHHTANRVVARAPPPTSKTTIKNAFIFHAGYAKKNIVPNKYNMGDFDKCDKYVLLLNDLAKNPGVAISMKQFKNLDALIAVAM